LCGGSESGLPRRRTPLGGRADLLRYRHGRWCGSDQQWADFLRDVVTPRFPEGLTTWPASGQWRAGDGSLTLENTHVLNLVHAADDATEKSVQAIIADYKDRFRQEAVLRVKTGVCVSF
jgi:uncharacterized protein DUF3574